MSDRYILDGHDAVPCPDLLDWGRWMQTADRKVAHTEFPEKGVTVSTVFLGLDHSFTLHSHGHIPILFETMIFGGEHDGWQGRYATWGEAENGHRHAEAVVKGEVTP